MKSPVLPIDQASTIKEESKPSIPDHALLKDNPPSPTLPLQPSLSTQNAPLILNSPSVTLAYASNPTGRRIARLPPSITLLSLPNELIIHILAWLSSSDLWSLVKLNRRLHHLALPLYLARYGLTPYTGVLRLFDDRSDYVVKAMGVALFKVELGKLECSVNLRKEGEEGRGGLEEILSLVEKVESIREVHLDFLIYGEGVDLREEMVTECEHQLKQNLDMFTHARAFEVVKVLNAVVQKGCTTLTVCLAGQLKTNFTEVKDVLYREFGVGGWVFVKLLHGAYKSVGTYLGHFPPPTELVSPPRVNLEEFNLRTPMLLHPLFLPWTLSTLNASRISKLSVNHVGRVDGFSWSLILPCICLPHLIHLSLDQASIEDDALYAFLMRHPGIKVLKLGQNILPPIDSTPVPKGIFGSVTHLSAYPRYLFFLLKAPESLQSLQSVEIIWRVLRKEVFDLGAMETYFLHPILERLGALPELRLLLWFESSNAEWMRLTPQPPSSSSMLIPGWSPVHIALLPRFSHLTLQIGTYRLPLVVRRALPKWIARFTGLKHLSFITLSKAGPVESSERTMFLNQIWESVKGLETVEINGEVVARW
ncbi:hypothetical protein BDQ12DRAFT_334483 [Crucibulum laeve]|uniref:F-box domain-containing protein n=1 Tax=Crucibulum laeve TaxID=68775 RepID=A0A5C3LRE4_9AGAR|nr:hypothetical protein BDQ12DRAFT_334483 [Crucibulum laeve]